MTRQVRKLWIVLALVAFGCDRSGDEPGDQARNEVMEGEMGSGDESPSDVVSGVSSSELLAKYTSFKLTADISHLSADQRAMLPLLMEAADEMDAIFWKQAYGDREDLMASIDDDGLRQFVEINYGPWDRLDGNRPFIAGVGSKPAGAALYPADMTREEFERAASRNPELRSLYTVVRRDESGSLKAVPYSRAFEAEMARAAALLRQAARLAEDEGFARYLTLRAEALENDEYQPSDMAWMDMKSNDIDFVVGPIEVYEDELFGYKAGAEAYLLIKDQEWSRRLSRFAALLPDLQQGLPVDSIYKRENPGTDSDLNAYDAIYYAGDANAGSKTIAINLPNDEEVQATKGSRRLQLKNAMQAKFDKILEPIADELIDGKQRKHVTFDAFFANTMLHEVAHGLGIKKTIDDSSTVREALRELYSALEEGKADILGLYMATSLIEQGEFDSEVSKADVTDNYVTFLASIFRSIRFGTSSAHGTANMIRFNFFREMEAFTRSRSGKYRVNADQIRAATDSLSARILMLQGDGDYEGAAEFVAKYAVVGDELRSDLERLSAAGIPVDITFVQGMTALR